MLSKVPRPKKPPPLAVGEVWRVQLPEKPMYPQGVISVEIEQMTTRTLVLRRRQDLDDGIFDQRWRLKREAVEFVERVR